MRRGRVSAKTFLAPGFPSHDKESKFSPRSQQSANTKNAGHCASTARKIVGVPPNILVTAPRSHEPPVVRAKLCGDLRVKSQYAGWAAAVNLGRERRGRTVMFKQ